MMNMQDTKVFRFYCELINFRRKGTPEAMLKCINPNEVCVYFCAAKTLWEPLSC